MRDKTATFLQKAGPFLVIALVVIGFILIMRLFRVEPQTQPRQDIGFLVETAQVKPEPLTLKIQSQGLLKPKHDISLVAEVSGLVTEVSDSFVVGGQFKQGDVLLQIEPADYQVAVSRSEANLASARANLDLEKAKAEQAQKDWESFGKKTKPSDLLLNIPQLKGAQAAVDAAKADLQKALRDLSKTTIKAPFDGTVLTKQVDIGQFVTVSGQLARLAGIETAEIRLPLTTRHLNQLQLSDNHHLPLPVTLHAVDGAEVGEAQLVRLEPQKDAQTMVTYGIAEVKNPFALGLRFNTFVSADIIGPSYPQVYPVPAEWLLPQQRLPLYRDGHLHIQPVSVIYQTDEFDYIIEGINEKDDIVITPIQFPEQGMTLRHASMTNNTADDQDNQTTANPS
ncbi:efflux RND transporter periplasmic adaptor subunit [Marinicella gelatinilytica]|uniref:efflux RND transporter periplasmic adaptor subunit n=1 Tax=Marinicella gelatinilytica TaxID=2996017 RepID=UPI002260F98D|nr:efflux RND transporter periplasmic adaptor subunit [Marinicella gelatinilytica]MCX7546118.1 efflux RND transporter periplasmic adaptor subunit [Marinicella gelatinilytica]